MIVGHKIERYLTAERKWFDDRAANWIITQHVVVTELHATKGWRKVKHARRNTVVNRLPPMSMWRGNAVTTFERTRKPGPVAVSEPAPVSEKAFMRHRERRRDRQREINRKAWEQAS